MARGDITSNADNAELGWGLCIGRINNSLAFLPECPGRSRGARDRQMGSRTKGAWGDLHCSMGREWARLVLIWGCLRMGHDTWLLRSCSYKIHLAAVTCESSLPGSPSSQAFSGPRAFLDFNTECQLLDSFQCLWWLFFLLGPEVDGMIYVKCRCSLLTIHDWSLPHTL
jgi:hypothetical protein